MSASLRIGSIGGIAIEVNFSWVIVFALLTFSLATSWFPFAAPGLGAAWYWLAGIIATLLLFASVLAHELAHSLVARRRGMPVKSITLFIFGGVSDIEREPQSPGAEFQMAFVGPLTSLIIGAIASLAAVALAAMHVAPILTAVIAYLGITNLLLGAFNLIPGFPMDGGRVLRSIIWRTTGSLDKATRWAVQIGQAIAYLMILAGIWLFFVGNALDGLWIGFIGLFLLMASQAESSRVQLEKSTAGISVGEAMSQAVAAEPHLTVQHIVDEYLLRSGQRAIPVVEDLAGQRLVGVVTLRDVRRLPREQWGTTRIDRIMTPLARLATATPAQPLSEALQRMAELGVNQMPVVAADGQLVGMLNLEAVLARIATQRELNRGAPVGAHSERQPVTPGADGHRTPDIHSPTTA